MYLMFFLVNCILNFVKSAAIIQIYKTDETDEIFNDDLSKNCASIIL